MVSKARELFPDPDRPVNTINRLRGRSTETLRRLCSRAPRTTRLPASASLGLPGSLLLTGVNLSSTFSATAPGYQRTDVRRGIVAPRRCRTVGMAIRPHVVIVGSGFGGLNAATRLAAAPVDITVVDRDNYHGFWPLLYQGATAGLGADDIAHPIRSIYAPHPNINA